jgi:hypothetical protein
MDAVSAYITDWEEVCKVVDKEKVDKFNELFEQIQVVLKMEGEDLDVSDCFIYFESSNYCSVESSLDEIEDKVYELKKVFDDILLEFKNKTDIKIFLTLNYDELNNENNQDNENCVYFELGWDDVVQLTPKAKKLQDKGVWFDLNEWVVGNY